MEGYSSHAYYRVIDYTMSTSLPYEGLVLLNGLNAGDGNAFTATPQNFRSQNKYLPYLASWA